MWTHTLNLTTFLIWCDIVVVCECGGMDVCLMLSFILLLINSRTARSEWDWVLGNGMMAGAPVWTDPCAPPPLLYASLNKGRKKEEEEEAS